jgi:biopolymer transport protein TolQ
MVIILNKLDCLSKINLHHTKSLMNPTQDLSFLSLVLNASLLVQLVILLLLGMSIASWTIIFKKGAVLRGVRNDTERFERDFWSGGDLNALLEASLRNKSSSAVLEHIFEAGMQEFMKLREIDAARRAMKATYQREMDILEANLPFLASVGSVSPYIGLFGTVWGIMHAFRGLANVQNATLSAVAPGIAEALVATAIGLFAAIPAVVAYNRNATDVDRLSIRFETFIEEFTNILQRQGTGK